MLIGTKMTPSLTQARKRSINSIRFARLRVVRDVRDLALAIEDVDRDEDDAELDAGEEEIDQLDTIREVDAEAIAFRVSARSHRVRDAIAARFDVAERVGRSLPLQRGLVAARDQGEVEEVEEVHRRIIASPALLFPGPSPRPGGNGVAAPAAHPGPESAPASAPGVGGNEVAALAARPGRGSNGVHLSTHAPSPRASRHPLPASGARGNKHDHRGLWPFAPLAGRRWPKAG